MPYIARWQFEQWDAAMNPIEVFHYGLFNYRMNGHTSQMPDTLEWHISPRLEESLKEREPSFGGIGSIVMGIPVTKIEDLPDGVVAKLVERLPGSGTYELTQRITKASNND